LLPGVNFINISLEASMRTDPKSAKRYWWLDWFVTLLGSVSVKAAHKMLVKLIPVLRHWDLIFDLISGLKEIVGDTMFGAIGSVTARKIAQKVRYFKNNFQKRIFNQY